MLSYVNTEYISEFVYEFIIRYAQKYILTDIITECHLPDPFQYAHTLYSFLLRSFMRIGGYIHHEQHDHQMISRIKHTKITFKCKKVHLISFTPLQLPLYLHKNAPKFTNISDIATTVGCVGQYSF